jgi:hypothetical protein
VEADKLCGAYGSKSENLKCVCQYFCVPTLQTGKPHLDTEPEKKTQAMMVDLVTKATNGNKEEKEEALENLKGILQHCLWNNFYQFQFGLHNNSGIHGACPWEVLHRIFLGFLNTTGRLYSSKQEKLLSLASFGCFGSNNGPVP